MIEVDPQSVLDFVGSGALEKANHRLQRYAVLLLRNSNLLLPYLSEPARSSFEQAVRMTQYAIAADPAFSSKLIETLADRDCRDETKIRILDLIASAGTPFNNWRLVAKLSESGSPAIRNRCLRLLAAYQNGKKMARLFDSDDARTRADLVEALVATDHPQTGTVLERALDDPNNRVAANAAAAAFRAGDQTVLRRLTAMITEDQPSAFRISAAWAMGQTGDCRFNPALLAAMKTGDPSLRTAALRALTRLEKFDSLTVDTAMALTCSIETPCSVPADHAAERTLFVDASADGSKLKSIPPLCVFLFHGKAPVLDYSVREAPTEEVQVGVACSAPCLEALATSLGAETSVAVKRIAVFGASSHFRADQTPVHSLSHAAKSLLSEWPGRRERHILLVLDAHFPIDIHLPLYETECRKLGITLHIREFDRGLSSSEQQVRRFVPEQAENFWRSFSIGLRSGIRITFEGPLAGLNLRVRSARGISEKVEW